MVFVCVVEVPHPEKHVARLLPSVKKCCCGVGCDLELQRLITLHATRGCWSVLHALRPAQRLQSESLLQLDGLVEDRLTMLLQLHQGLALQLLLHAVYVLLGY